MSDREIIEWTLQKVLDKGETLMDDFYYNRDSCLIMLEKELKDET